MNYLELNDSKLRSSIDHVFHTFEKFKNEQSQDILPRYTKSQFKAYVGECSFEYGEKSFIEKTLKQLNQGTLNLAAPGYMGVFNPNPLNISAVASIVNSLYNSQLASKISAPFPVFVEKFLIDYFGKRAGYQSGSISGSFTSGGTEGNISATLMALQSKFPQYKRDGLRALGMAPKMYASVDAHHSIQRASFVSGLGINSLVELSVTIEQKIDLVELERLILRDIDKGEKPFLLFGTLGTTGTGSIDDLEKMAEIAKKYNMWFHVDAAYGGAALILDEHTELTKGIGLSDSFSVDAHKWLALPFGSSLLVSRHKNIGRNTFETFENVYMPKQTESTSGYEPYRDSIQWSRGFRGLGLFLALGFYGRKGLALKMKSQLKVSKLLRQNLEERGFTIYNEAKLPVLCFGHTKLNQKNISLFREQFISKNPQYYLTDILISPNKIKALRISINNNELSELGIREFISDLENELNNFQSEC
jgi:glutamate/tyrosine decarboxylase-like PLP-dependent enzyme